MGSFDVCIAGKDIFQPPRFTPTKSIAGNVKRGGFACSVRSVVRTTGWLAYPAALTSAMRVLRNPHKDNRLAFTMTAPASNDCAVSEPTSPVTSPGQLVVPAHGNGKLRRGNPGNRGGIGLPPSRLRAALRLDFARRRKALRDIADNAPKESDRIAAINLMARYGLRTETQMTVISPDVVDRISKTLHAVMACPDLNAEAKERLMLEIEAAWG